MEAPGPDSRLQVRSLPRLPLISTTHWSRRSVAVGTPSEIGSPDAVQKGSPIVQYAHAPSERHHQRVLACGGAGPCSMAYTTNTGSKRGSPRDFIQFSGT